MGWYADHGLIHALLLLCTQTLTSTTTVRGLVDWALDIVHEFPCP